MPTAKAALRTLPPDTVWLRKYTSRPTWRGKFPNAPSPRDWDDPQALMEWTMELGASEWDHLKGAWRSHLSRQKAKQGRVDGYLSRFLPGKVNWDQLTEEGISDTDWAALAAIARARGDAVDVFLAYNQLGGLGKPWEILRRVAVQQAGSPRGGT